MSRENSLLDYKSTAIEENKESKDQDYQSWLQKQPFIRRNYGYIGLFAGVLIGVQTFLYEVVIYTQVDTDTYALYSPMFVAYFSFYALYHLKEAIISKTKYGSFWVMEKSSYLIFEPLGTLESGAPVENSSWFPYKVRINKFNVYAVFGRGLVAIIASQMMMLILYTESLANMNFSLIANILALTPFLIAVIFYFVFKEKLNIYLVLGIALILTCAIMTSMSSDSSTSGVAYLTPVIPVILAVVQATLGAVICLITRYIVLHSNINVQQICSDCFFMEGMIFLIWYLVLDFPYSNKIFWSIAALQFVALCSMLLLNLAGAFGKAAPSLALGNCSGLYSLILEILILSKVPSTLQIIAFCFGFAGALMIAFESRKEKSEDSTK